MLNCTVFEKETTRNKPPESSCVRTMLQVFITGSPRRSASLECACFEMCFAKQPCCKTGTQPASRGCFSYPRLSELRHDCFKTVQFKLRCARYAYFHPASLKRF